LLIILLAFQVPQMEAVVLFDYEAVEDAELTIKEGSHCAALKSLPFHSIQLLVNNPRHPFFFPLL